MKVYYYALRNRSGGHTLIEEDRRLLKKGQWKVWITGHHKFFPVCQILKPDPSGNNPNGIPLLYSQIRHINQFIGAKSILWDVTHEAQRPSGEKGGPFEEVIVF